MSPQLPAKDTGNLQTAAGQNLVLLVLLISGLKGSADPDCPRPLLHQWGSSRLTRGASQPKVKGQFVSPELAPAVPGRVSAGWWIPVVLVREGTSQQPLEPQQKALLTWQGRPDGVAPVDARMVPELRSGPGAAGRRLESQHRATPACLSCQGCFCSGTRRSLPLVGAVADKHLCSQTSAVFSEMRFVGTGAGRRFSSPCLAPPAGPPRWSSGPDVRSEGQEEQSRRALGPRLEQQRRREK